MNALPDAAPQQLQKAAAPLSLAVIGLALFYSLPELLLINLELWMAVIAAVWAFGSLFGASLTAYAIPALIFGGLGLWATAVTLRMAMRSYRETH